MMTRTRGIISLATVTVALLFGTSCAAAAPSTTRYHDEPSAPSDAALARLRQCESGGNYAAVSASGRYRGAYQFDRATWRSVGGTGDPATASPREQDYRARLLYASRGRYPWPVCGRRL